MYDNIIIGCGFAGSVIARELAEKGESVLIMEKRSHIGGNCYDSFDEHGIIIHNYGPHIFHTQSKKVYDYLSKYTKWFSYSHEVAGAVHDLLLPIPFNLNSLKMVYGEEKGSRLEEHLLSQYGEGTKVPILELKKNPSKDIRDLAQYVYENVFLYYTMKQWGQKPEEIDSSVTARVPVLLSHDNRYFQDAYQGMPLNGYTCLFEKLLQHENIKVLLNTDGLHSLTVRPGEKIVWNGKPYGGRVIYTGPIDELFRFQFGHLPYRSLLFRFQYFLQEYYQSHAVVNYTVSEEYTRITEFKHMTGQRDKSGTTIVKEYPCAYEPGGNGSIPYYAILNKENRKLYDKYKELADRVPQLYLLGRLAEYQYYNMDAIVEKALLLGEALNSPD